MDTIQTIDLIAVNPKVRGGRPFIRGTTVTVYEHKADIDQSITERRKLAAEMKEKRVGSRHQPRFG